MSQSKIVTILLVVLIVCGWGMTLLSGGSINEKEYKEHLELGDDYLSRGLYQKAIDEYEDAVEINEKRETGWDCLLNAYQLRYEEDDGIYSDYLEALVKAISLFEKNEKFVVALGELCISEEEYETAYKYLAKAIEKGVNAEKVNSMYLQVKYAYELAWSTYSEYVTCNEGEYAVCEGIIWSYIKEDGSSTDFENLSFAGIVGDDGVRVIESDSRIYLVDADEVMQGVLDFKPSEVGVYMEELIAIKNGDQYGYYNCLGDLQFGKFIEAGTFEDSRAAVKNENVWFLIDEDGERISDKEYVDIVLNLDKTHIKKGVMIARVNDAYQFFDEDEELISDSKFENCDVVTKDKKIAVCQNGKWGFVDDEGKFIIEPQYENAKSFSNGLAAVCIDGKWGFIDEDNRLVIDCQFFDADYFNESGCCMVKTTVETWQLLRLYIVE